MSTLEDRLRSELARTGQAAHVPTGPSVDTISGAVAARRRRNRIASRVGAAVVVVGIGAAGFVAVMPSGEPSVVAAGAESTTEEAAVVSDAATALEESADLPLDDVAVEEVEDGGEPAEGVAGEAAVEEAQASPLQAGDAPAGNITVRESNISFAGGSGVLIEPTSSGQYLGLASRFGNSGAIAIGISSANGLDWEEFSLTGVPAGATPTHLASYNGAFVALFAQPSANGPGLEVLVGTSADLATWNLSEPLPGDEVFPHHLAVGPSGVLILGDDLDRARWSGPIGGPYEEAPPITDLGVISSVGVVGDDFVIVGFAREVGGAIVIVAPDGDLSVEPIALPDGVDAVAAEVNNGSVFVTASDSSTYISDDAGSSWTQVELDATLLGSSANGATSALLSSPSNLTMLQGDDLSTTAIDIAPGDRVELLAVNGDEALLLVTSEGSLDWIVVEG